MSQFATPKRQKLVRDFAQKHGASVKDGLDNNLGDHWILTFPNEDLVEIDIPRQPQRSAVAIRHVGSPNFRIDSDLTVEWTNFLRSNGELK
jgi:hypothetical protein